MGVSRFCDRCGAEATERAGYQFLPVPGLTMPNGASITVGMQASAYTGKVTKGTDKRADFCDVCWQEVFNLVPEAFRIYASRNPTRTPIEAIRNAE